MGYNGWINSQVDNDYQRARFSATLNNIVNFLRNEPRTLLPFEEVRSRIHIRGQIDRGIQNVPLDAIIGSEGRYADFDRQFLPRHEISKDRWKNINRARYGDVALPPIELYKIDDVYFVRDGNHRVSVARQQEQEDIEAHVIELVSDVDIDPNMTTDDLAKLEEQSDFLEWTHLAQLRPDHEIELSQPGGYLDLIRQINGHRYFKSLELGRELTRDEAVMSWYDTLYVPILKAIKETGVMAAFPKRTPADLYLWIMDHRHHLTQTEGYDPGAQEAVLDYTRHYAERRSKVNIPPPPTRAETEFLDWSQLGRLRPSIRIPLSDDKDYARLRLHILDHQYFLGKNLGREIKFEEASQSWFDTVYEPIARAAIEQGTGDLFPKTTLGDVYLLITDYLHYKRGQGVEIDPAEATREYAKQFDTERASFLTGILHRARKFLRFSLVGL